MYMIKNVSMTIKISVIRVAQTPGLYTYHTRNVPSNRRPYCIQFYFITKIL